MLFMHIQIICMHSGTCDHSPNTFNAGGSVLICVRIQPHAEIMTQSQCVMMTDTNGTIFCRTGKEAQVRQTRTDGVYCSLVGVTQRCSRREHARIQKTTTTPDFQDAAVSPTSESGTPTLNDMFWLASVGGFLLKWVHFTKASLTAHARYSL